MARFTVPSEPAMQVAPEPPPEPETAPKRFTVHDPDTPNPFLMGAYQGATFEWGDELAGLFTDKEEFRRKVKAAAAASPGRYQAGKLTGAVGTSLIPAGGMLRAGATLGQATRAGAKLGAIFGGTEAAGEYESKGRGLSDELTDAGVQTAVGAGTGALVGGALTPALYSLLAGGRAGGRMLYDYLQGGSHNSALRKTEEALRRQGTEAADLSGRLVADARPMVQQQPPEVLATMMRGLQAGQSATDVAAAVNRAHGVQLTPQQVGAISAGFDRANPVPRDLLRLSEEVGGGEAGRSGLTNLMQAVTTIPGRGREVALRNMGATMEAAPERMAQRLSGELGDLDFRGAMATREATRRTQADAAYGAARRADDTVQYPSVPQQRQVPVHSDDAVTPRAGTMEDHLEPILTGFALRAQRMGGETGSKVAQGVEIMSGVRPGSTEFGINSLERFHEARKTLDQFIRSVNTGPSADWNAGRILRGMRDELNQFVYQHNAAFQAADRQFANNIAREEAMRLGRQMNLRSGEAHDDVLREMRALERRNPEVAEELRDHFMQGSLRRLADEIENSGGIPPRWMQPLTGGIRPAPREALESALGAPMPNAPVAQRTSRRTGAVRGQPVPYAPGRETAQGVGAVLEDEARLRKIFTDVFSNSKTAERLAAQEDLRALPGIAAELATGGLTGLKNAVTKRLMLAITERNAEQISRIITETDPRVLFVALQDIQRMAPRIRAGETMMGAPAAALSSALGQSATGQ